LVVYASSASALFSVIQILFYDPSAIFIQAEQIYWLSLLNASLCTVIPMLLIMIAINRIGSPLVAQAGILGPVSTLFMGWAVLSEPITWVQVGGMGLVIGAMWLLVRNDTPSKPIGLDTTKSIKLERADPLN
jgi:drug/metabolite transporter (DMT)-like permease